MESAEIFITTAGDSQKQANLDQMKRLATGLLVAAFIIFLVAAFFEKRYEWVGFIRATAEAAMVGAIADWFAVTALFRYPLGLKIPHTAIVPRRKDTIGRTLGQFVKNNFLTPTVISERLRSMDVTRQLARWLSRPENSAAIADYVMLAVGAAAQVMKDEEVQELIEQSFTSRLRTLRVAPFLGSALAVIMSGPRQREMLTGVVRLGDALLKENEAALTAKIMEEIPWWLPRGVGHAIYDKIVEAYERTLRQISRDPDHPLHQKFDELVLRLVDDLKHSPELVDREKAWKDELLEHPVVREFSSSLWTDTKRLLLDGSQAEFDLARPVQQGLMRFAGAILADEVMQHKIDRWVEEGAVYLIREYGHEVEQLIAQTIARWDAAATSRKIELQIGRDLQFIRINGTVVGGLVGLLIHTLVYFIPG